MKGSFVNFLVAVKEYVLITLGILCYTVGMTLFIIPNNLVGGGVSGVAAIVQYATGGLIKIGYTYLAVNAILIIAAIAILGKSFGVKSVYAILLTSVLLNWWQSILPPDIIQSLALDNGKLMSTIMGAMLIGLGIGLSMSQGGSTGGTDIIALIINKYRNASPGKLLLSMDVVIILSSMLVPSYTSDGSMVVFTDKIITVVYGFILISISSLTLDMYLSGSKQSVQLLIFSKEYARIADAVNNDLHKGVTVLDGKGWYTKESTQVLVVMMRKSDLNLMLKTVKSIDPDAFLSVSTVMGVYGQGFDSIRFRKK